MYVIDTNVASELMRPEPAPAVMAWVARRDVRDLCLTAISEAELRCEIAIVLAGKRKNDLETAMIRWLDRGFGERILPFDSAAAGHCAEIAHVGAMWADLSKRPIARLPPFAAYTGLSWRPAMFGISLTSKLQSPTPGWQNSPPVTQHLRLA